MESLYDRPRGRREQTRAQKKTDHSKQLTTDVRALLWVVTVGGLLLAFYCVRRGFTGALPWVTAMVGLPWSAHGVICAFYLNMSKSDHKAGGITFESAKAKGFVEAPESVNSPPI